MFTDGQKDGRKEGKKHHNISRRSLRSLGGYNKLTNFFVVTHLALFGSINNPLGLDILSIGTDVLGREKIFFQQ